ncbi:MAG: hypothetical protein ACR2OZ_10735 [Verrucomicrobiales bacterium]
MTLALYSSVPEAEAPNLVALQDEALTGLPTVLVCPLRPAITVTSLRVEVAWHGHKLVACLELARPVRRTALRVIGRLDDRTSQAVMTCFFQLLAR